MGGDCLNTGCVPSKALIACARKFQEVNNVKELEDYGITTENIKEDLRPFNVNFSKVMKRMRAIRAKISHHDSVQRYSRDFCESVFVGHAEFLKSESTPTYNGEVCVTGDDGSKRILQYKKAMVATGASASIPPIPGLKDIPHLTNGSFFNLTELPETMLVVGCGPIGLELAQSMSRFGCKVICLERGSQLLTREDQMLQSWS